MDLLEDALLSIRNGMTAPAVDASHAFTTRGLRLARKLGLARFDAGFGEIKLTKAGWVKMREMEDAWNLPAHARSCGGLLPTKGGAK